MEYQDIKAKLTELKKSNEDIMTEIRSLRKKLIDSINKELNESGKKYIGKYYIKTDSPTTGMETCDIIKIVKFEIVENYLYRIICDNWWYSADQNNHTINNCTFTKDLNCFEEFININNLENYDTDKIINELLSTYTEITEDEFRKHHLPLMVKYMQDCLDVHE